MLALLESRLLQVGRSGAEEAAVFYLKMTADYYRYMSEFKPKAHGEAASTANSEVRMDFFFLFLAPFSLSTRLAFSRSRFSRSERSCLFLVSFVADFTLSLFLFLS